MNIYWQYLAETVKAFLCKNSEHAVILSGSLPDCTPCLQGWARQLHRHVFIADKVRIHSNSSTFLFYLCILNAELSKEQNPIKIC